VGAVEEVKDTNGAQRPVGEKGEEAPALRGKVALSNRCLGEEIATSR
jgi:hypothetical protein